MVKRDKTDESLGKIIELMQADSSIDAPASSIKWAKDLFRTRIAQPKESVFQRILAVMTVDLATGKPAFGERSAGVAQERQLFFSAGKTGIDIRIVKKGKLYGIRGQVLGEGFEIGAARLSGGDLEKESPVIKSEFVFEDLPQGAFDLAIRTDGEEILIEELEIKV